MNIQNKKKILLLGGNLRNKGAWLMVDVSIKKIFLNHEIFFLTPFKEDLELFEKYYSNYDIKKVLLWSPKEIIKTFLKLPIKLIYNNPINDVFKEVDFVVDISGVVFVEKRGLLYLIYNSLTTLIPFYYKKKLIKLPQAFGPIDSYYYLKVAKFVLNKCGLIFSRGRHSSKTLQKLQINYFEATDIGFFNDSKKKASLNSNTKVIAISPSVIVSKKFQNQKISYLEFLNKLINNLIATNYKVLIFPNSASKKNYNNNFNDLDVCIKLDQFFKNTNSVKIYKDDLNPEEIENIIVKSDIIISSRFHSMIVALNNNVVPIVLGWNSKYIEVLKEFELENNYIDDFKNLDSILDNINQLISCFESDYRKIEYNLKIHKNKLKVVIEEVNKFIQ